MTPRAWLGFLVGIVLLQCCARLQYPYTWEVLRGDVCRLSPDLLLLLGLAAFGAASGRPRLWAHLAALLLLMSMLFHATIDLMDVYRPGYEFELLDVPQLPWFLDLLFERHPLWYRNVVLSGVATGLIALHLVLAWCFAAVVRPARESRGAYGCALVLQVLAIYGVVWTSSVSPGSAWGASWLAQFADNAARTANKLIDPERFERQLYKKIEVAAERLDKVSHDLTKLGGADVHLVFVESYGRMATRHAELGPPLRSLWPSLERNLCEAGFHMRSATCYPAISGGASWLAHAQLFAGLHVTDNRIWELLMSSSLSPIPKRFAEAGYHTVEILPAVREDLPEDERARVRTRAQFYGFAESLTRLEMPYDGTPYPMGRMPDQFALHHLLERVVKPATTPLLTTFISCSSHAPFSPVPPYIEDWRIGADTFKRPPQADYELEIPSLPNNPKALQAYRDVIEYSLRTLVGFTCRLTRPSLVIALGDHQPPIAASTSVPDRSKDVLIHVFANRAELLEPFRAMGFVEGFEVPADMVAFDTADFAQMLFKGFAK
ncbi:MAG TPA: hypothetical protein VFT55_14200 [Planctomycetota bacterium]|nr:hypothetical protein [Planctomycetota bacterium]